MSTTNYLGAPTLGDLHSENIDWQHRLDFYKFEAGYLQRMLEKNVGRVEKDAMRTVEHLQNKLIYYLGEVIDGLIHEVKVHEAKLPELFNGDNIRLESTVREEHYQLKDKVSSLSKEFRNLKREMFTFVENL